MADLFLQKTTKFCKAIILQLENKYFKKKKIKEKNWVTFRGSCFPLTVLLLFSCTVVSLCDSMCCSTPGLPVLHHLPELAETHVYSDPSSHLSLCHPLLLLLSIFPSIRVFSSELTLHIRWPKNWSFSFSISPSNEYSELISFRKSRLLGEISITSDMQMTSPLWQKVRRN